LQIGLAEVQIVADGGQRYVGDQQIDRRDEVRQSSNANVNQRLMASSVPFEPPFQLFGPVWKSRRWAT
jgi:hypothetical protein